MSSVFESTLGDLSERHRDEVLAAFAAVENSVEPVPEMLLPGLRDATLRRYVQDLLHRVGRTLVPLGHAAWTSGYRDDIAAELTRGGWNALPMTDRAVLTLILIHSVAIPRTEGKLHGDSWADATPTPVDELVRYSQIARQDVDQGLRRLRAAGLVRLIKGRHGQGRLYAPGLQFHRLTDTARRRLQEELILAAGPDTPLAAAIRARRHSQQGDA